MQTRETNLQSTHSLKSGGGGKRLKEQTLLVQKPVDCFFFFNLLFFFFLVLGQDLCETDHRGKAEAPHTDRV